MNVPFVAYVTLNRDAPLDPDSFPGNLEFTRDFHLDFDSPVTFFVGENGSGKSTLLEAMAVLARLPISGGGLNESDVNHAFAERSILANALRLAFIKQPEDRYFFRAETQAHFASLLEQRRDDPDFGGDPFTRYGGRSLHQMSHGEAFLSIMQNRFEHGLFLMDEPESALSPQRQLTLLVLMHRLVQTGKSQFFVATHSPILLVPVSWAASVVTLGACLTCTEMSWSGARIGIKRARTGWSGAGAGTSPLRAAGRRTATGTSRRTAAATWASGSPEFLLPVPVSR